MEQVAKATCILCKKLQRTRGGTWRFPRVSRAKSGILWLSGGTTRVRWCGASYLGPSMGVRYILARHTRRSHTDCNPEARAYAHLAGPRHDGGTDWHAHVPQWWPMVLCTLPPHVGKPLPTYVGPAFPGASSCLKHPTDRQACLCRVADRRLVVTGSALLDAHVSLPRWWRVSYAPARPTQDGAGPRRRPSACPRRASAEIPVSQHC